MGDTTSDRRNERGESGRHNLRDGRGERTGAGTPAFDALMRESGLPRLEAGVLLAHAAGATRAWLAAHGDEPSSPDVARRARTLFARRRSGEPVAYLVGEREFYGLAIEVTPHALIPRPETELLVDLALGWLDADTSARVLDLGTGSGAIAAAIAAHRPRARVIAADASPEALEVAARNVRRHGLRNVELLRSRWWEGVRGAGFDLVVSNPPYVAESDPHLAQGDLRFEPRTALVAGADGLDALRVIVAGAPARLVPGGRVALEHGWDQGEACAHLLRAAGLVEVGSHRDLAGHARVASGRRAAE